MTMPEQDWGMALLFAVEPSDRALTGWRPGTRPVDPHPQSWARWMLRWLADVEEGT